MQNGERRVLYILCAVGILPVCWLALLTAPFIEDGLIVVVQRLPEALEHPFHIHLCHTTMKTILLFLVAYGMSLGIALSSPKNYRRREEHGSAKWGDPFDINRRYRDKDPMNNKIMTMHIQMSYQQQEHRRNMLTLVIGGSGAGKTRFYAKPNLMLCNTSFVVLDPKGELLRDTGMLLEAEGYKIVVLDLLNMEKSHCYNPFVYLETDNDVQRLATNLFRSTQPKGSQTQDPFWDNAAKMLLQALVFFLWYEAPEEEQNFPMVMELLLEAEVREDDDSYRSPVDVLFDRLAMRQPDHIALRYYRSYHSGSAKTLKSIQVTLTARLEKFNLSSVAALTSTDELNLRQIGDRKTALFARIPDNDTSFNFLVSILYTQLFQQLFRAADEKEDGKLPVHVHFLMDEFANVALPDDFEKIVSVMRSREISVSIILQNLAQIKALFEKEWESISGNCDEFLYLGGNEQSSHKYVSELLGKATIDLNTYGKSSGHNGNHSTNYQNSGRELLTPDEVRMLSNEQAILLIRGEYPIKDLKYDIMKHPNIDRTADGGMPPYRHGTVKHSTGTITFDSRIPPNAKRIDSIKTNYELLSEDELQEHFDL